ncbi:MAG: hypothetical protein AAF192_11465 [Pseudomonadota bacterium]
MSGAAVVALLQAYAALGLVVAAALALWGAGRVESNARGAWAFRLLLIPGAVLLWPLVAWRLAKLLRGAEGDARAGAGAGAKAHRPPRRAQDAAALLLALFVPLALGTAAAIRQDGPLHAAPALLEAPAEAAPTEDRPAENAPAETESQP